MRASLRVGAKESRDCLQDRTFDESYVSATNTEKPEGFEVAFMRAGLRVFAKEKE